MQTTIAPGTDGERLSALHRYDILDTPPEERYDRVARLAKRWFDVPIALITFLDENREWFKSHIGMEREEVDRENAFCRYTVQSHSLLVVEDATQDPRFSDNPLVTGPPGIRFYAGAPLLSPDGIPLGALCVLDTSPRSEHPNDLDVLRDLAGIVSDELELRSTHQNLEERNQQVESLAEALTKAEESERHRLSQLLHDDLQQILHSARMKLDVLRNSVAQSDQVANEIRDVEDKIREATEMARTLSTRFAPPFGDNSLRDALDWLANKMEERHNLSVSVLARGPAPVSKDALKTLLFRLVRELLFNVVKHAETDTADVLLVEGNERLRVVVEDEGKGFDPDQQVQNGFGLANIRERIEIMGGTVEVRSEPGVGTRVVVEVPWENESGSRTG